MQDVNDVLTAIDHVVNLGLASPSKIVLLGGSHGGFLTTHLIGQVLSIYCDFLSLTCFCIKLSSHRSCNL